VATFQDKLEILRQLAEGGGLTDTAGVNVSLGRTRQEMATLASLLGSVRELAVMQEKKFARLTRRYRDLQFSIRFTIEGALATWCNALVENVGNGSWILQTDRQEPTTLTEVTENA
jgi:hypothetical protein